MKTPLFYRETPVFGLDIGHDSVKIMQIESGVKKDIVLGYGHVAFDPQAIKKGVIMNPETIAREIYKLITKHMVGTINTKTIAAAIPVASTYARVLLLPKMEAKDLAEAVTTEVSQYIPVPIEELYVDFDVVAQAKNDMQEVLAVAAPKNIVDSYINLFSLLDLEVAIVESSVNSVARIVSHAERTGIPTLLIDIGSLSSDMAVLDTTVRLTGGADAGGEHVSQAIMKAFGVTGRQAYTIKTRYGLDKGRRQTEIVAAVEPILIRLITEIKKVIRFYEDRSGTNQKIEQVIILGGGANLPGLSTYLTDKLRLPTRLCDPWQNMNFGKLQPPHPFENTLYTTAAGLALVKPREIYQ